MILFSSLCFNVSSNFSKAKVHSLIYNTEIQKALKIHFQKLAANLFGYKTWPDRELFLFIPFTVTIYGFCCRNVFQSAAPDSTRGSVSPSDILDSKPQSCRQETTVGLDQFVPMPPWSFSGFWKWDALKSLGTSAIPINFKMATSIKKDVLNKQDYHSGFVKGGKHGAPIRGFGQPRLTKP